MTSSQSVLSQSRTPILESLIDHNRAQIESLHTPAHKQGRFAPKRMCNLIGTAAFELDLPPMHSTDSGLFPQKSIREAEALAEQLWGASRTRFLDGGASLGVMVSLCAVTRRGMAIGIGRDAHRSAIQGMIHSGAEMVYLHGADVYPNPPVSVDELALHIRDNDNLSGVFLTRPNYLGLAFDLVPIIALCHSKRIPVIIDESHGGHLPFLDEGPLSALECGADLVVQSVHKTMGGLCGSALIHVNQNSLIPSSVIDDTLRNFQSTSPSFLILASIDAARHALANGGGKRFSSSLSWIAELRSQISRLEGLRLLEEKVAKPLEFDPMRLTVHVTEIGMSGFEVERWLRDHAKIECEYSDDEHVCAVLTPADETVAKKLLNTLADLSKRRAYTGDRLEPRKHYVELDHALSPRTASMMPRKAVQLDRSIGSICAEIITPYPPGIPLVIPGARVSEEIVASLKLLRSNSSAFHAVDPTLQSIQVIVGEESDLEGVSDGVK